MVSACPSETGSRPIELIPTVVFAPTGTTFLSSTTCRHIVLPDALAEVTMGTTFHVGER